MVVVMVQTVVNYLCERSVGCIVMSPCPQAPTCFLCYDSRHSSDCESDGKGCVCLLEMG